MIEHWENDDFCIEKIKMLPVSVRECKWIQNVDELMRNKSTSISFKNDDCAIFEGKGSMIVLDFGKELCGSLRFIIREGRGVFHITLGESLSEAYSSIGHKNATNNHSPRDFEATVVDMSDLSYGHSGFRFARIELVSDQPVHIKNIFAVNHLPVFEKEGYIVTDDDELNEIIKVAAYTLKLNFQNGYIWDGIKRDRLVWSGDLNQEIVTSIYLYGDNKNITNSLTFLRNETPPTEWINQIPSYSAWWIINLCDYCRLIGNKYYFKENKEYAKAILKNINGALCEDGTMNFHGSPGKMNFFLDWQTYETDDAVIGTAMVFRIAAQKFLEMEECEVCAEVIRKTDKYLEYDTLFKQTRSFQILAGRRHEGDVSFLEQGGATGFSTFMAYYILKAYSMLGGINVISMIKEYYGAMLSRGATTFWEDFNIEWLDGSSRIDELPNGNEKDLHGDYGAFCYKGFRHSLCHGWSCGVLGFLYEYLLGILPEKNSDTYSFSLNMIEVKEIEAKVPTKSDWLYIKI